MPLFTGVRGIGILRSSRVEATRHAASLLGYPAENWPEVLEGGNKASGRVLLLMARLPLFVWIKTSQNGGGPAQHSPILPSMLVSEHTAFVKTWSIWARK